MDTTISNALTTAGLVPTVVSPAHSYSGTPAATGFGAVILALGNDTSIDMSTTGQTAILNAFNAGTGTVFTDWVVYESLLPAHYATLKPLFLTTYSTSLTGAETYTLTSAGHSIWTGIPSPFTTTIFSMDSIVGSITNGGTQIATGSVGGSAANGIVVKNATGSAGRTVQIDNSANYQAGWTSDANLLKLFTNSAKWAAGCL